MSTNYRSYCISCGKRTELDKQFMKIMDELGEPYGPKLKEFVVERWGQERETESIQEMIRNEVEKMNKEFLERIEKIASSNYGLVPQKFIDSLTEELSGDKKDEAAKKVDAMMGEW